MKQIKIKFCDFWPDFDPEQNDFTRILRKRYDVQFGDEPDFLFYSGFGEEHLRYHCTKIFYTGECEAPNFNLCDYAMGFDPLTFGDRYLRMPLYQLFQYRKDLETALLHRDTAPKEGFCSFVVSNDNGMSQRREIFDLLNGYKPVASGGRYRNNVGGPVADKQAFLARYKFNIAFENCVCPGYTTEKIVQAFAAGAIPIYYGDPEVVKEFNPKAFINCHDYPSLEAVVERVREIDENDDLYRSMLAEPVTGLNLLDEIPLEMFLYHIFDQSPEAARRRPRNTRVENLEERERLSSRMYHLWVLPKRRVSALLRRLRNRSL